MKKEHLNPCSKIMITFDVGQHEDKYRLIYVLLCLDWDNSSTNFPCFVMA